MSTTELTIDTTDPEEPTSAKAGGTSPGASATVYPILFAISISHLLNDTLQALIPSIYPLIKDGFGLTFAQIGIITLAFQMSGSIFQPIVGYITDKRPQPYSLALGMCSTLTGLILLSQAGSYNALLVSVCLMGFGSSVFHPEASRMAYHASGGRRGFAQSLFQVGGNAGSAIGPLLAAMIVVPHGRGSVLWFSGIALLAIAVLSYVGRWFKGHIIVHRKSAAHAAPVPNPYSTGITVVSITILLLLIFSKFFYMVSMTSYFTFYLMEKFSVSVQESQTYLFVFLAAVAVGTFAGGPIGDRIGRKYVIWASILGAAPFTLALPYANLFWTILFVILIGLVLSSAFSAILVYAQELLPGKVGMISGLFFGFAFGIAGIGSAVLGQLADWRGLDYVYHICSFLPLIGLLTVFLPNVESSHQRLKRR